MQRDLAVDPARLLFVGGRWDDEIVVVDLAAALNPDNRDSDRAVRARIPTTPQIDTSAGRVRASGQPVGVVFSPDRRLAYAINHSGRADPARTAAFQHGYRGSLAVIDIARALDPARTHEAVIDLIETGTAGPVGAAFLPDGQTLAVTSAEAEGLEDGGAVVTLIDTQARRVIRHVPLATGDGAPCRHPAPHADFGRYPCPNGLAFTPLEGGLILTANGGTDDVSLIGMAPALAGRDDAEIARVGVGPGPFAIAVSPDGRTAAVTDREDARTGESGRTVSLIDIAAAAAGHPDAVRRIDITRPGEDDAPRPFGLAFAQDGRRLVATCFTSGTLALVDPDAGRVDHLALPMPDARPARPRGIATVPGTTLCAVAGGAKGAPRSGRLWVIDLAAWKVAGTVDGIGNEPYLVDIAQILVA